MRSRRLVDWEITVSIMAGAEPYAYDGGPVGVVLCHGFTGSPQSLRPWADYLVAAGLSVRLPLLPGHGRTWQNLARTSWQEWYDEIDRAFLDLRQRSDQIFAMGLSMGAALALRLAQVRGSDIRGLVLVNPSVVATRQQVIGVTALRRFVPSMRGIASDIKKPGVTELAYDRVSLRAADSMLRLHRVVRAELAAVTQPVVIYRSATDHVVPAASSAYLVKNAGSTELEEIVLTDSFHVATLDHDADRIFAGSVEFVRAHSDADQPDTAGPSTKD